MTPTYIDGLGSVRVANGIVHIELVTVMPPAGEGQTAKPEVASHLVMALPQFVRLCAEMGSQLQRMEQKGLIARKPQA